MESPELQGFENALETPYLDLWVPVLASLLPDYLLGVGSVDGYPLRGNASLVFVTCNLELLGELSYALGYVVNRLHAFNVGLLQSHSQIVRLSWIALGAVIQLHALPLIARKG